MEINARDYCIDSDILIDFLRGMEHAEIFLQSKSTQRALYISAVSVTEIWAGKTTRNTESKNDVEEKLKNFLLGFRVVPIDAILAKRAGVLRREYDMPFADAIVAATAAEHELVLVTRNIRHFATASRGERFPLLQPY